jgi:gamma-glutamylcysteine synthetase
MVCIAEAVHPSCTDSKTISKWTKTRFHMTHITLEFHRVRPKQFLRLWYIRHKPCTYLATRLALSLNGLNRASTWASTPRVPSGASKMISKPTVCLAQTMHLSCTDTNTISKWTKMRFHMTHITLEFHRVHPKWFLRLCYVQHKPCTYLASRLALSLNGLNQASTWASSQRSTIRCVQNNF